MATSEAKPNGFLEIPAGKETAFLWPMTVDKIPMVGKQTEMQLRSIGINTIAQIAQRGPDALERELGKWGRRLWEKSMGIDDNPVEGWSEQKSLSHETTFDADSSDGQFLHTELLKLTERNAYDLRRDEKLTGCVTVKIRYSDFTTVSKQEVMEYTALDDVLLARVKALFAKLYRRGEKVRLLGVKFSHLIPMTMQMNLFDRPEEKLELYKTVDDLKARFGSAMITKAGALKGRKGE